MQAINSIKNVEPLTQPPTNSTLIYQTVVLKYSFINDLPWV